MHHGQAEGDAGLRLGNDVLLLLIQGRKRIDAADGTVKISQRSIVLLTGQQRVLSGQHIGQMIAVPVLGGPVKGGCHGVIIAALHIAQSVKGMPERLFGIAALLAEGDKPIQIAAGCDDFLPAGAVQAEQGQQLGVSVLLEGRLQQRCEELQLQLKTAADMGEKGLQTQEPVMQ